MLPDAMLFLEFARNRDYCISQAFFCHKPVLFHQHCWILCNKPVLLHHLFMMMSWAWQGEGRGRGELVLLSSIERGERKTGFCFMFVYVRPPLLSFVRLFGLALLCGWKIVKNNSKLFSLYGGLGDGHRRGGGGGGEIYIIIHKMYLLWKTFW